MIPPSTLARTLSLPLGPSLAGDSEGLGSGWLLFAVGRDADWVLPVTSTSSSSMRSMTSVCAVGAAALDGVEPLVGGDVICDAAGSALLPWLPPRALSSNINEAILKIDWVGALGPGAVANFGPSRLGFLRLAPFSLTEWFVSEVPAGKLSGSRLDLIKGVPPNKG